MPARSGQEQVDQLDRSPLRRLYSVRRSNGSERIRWRTGSHHGITAGGETSGHGFTLDLAVIDEAWAQVDDRLVQSFRPAMVTRADAQLWIVSTAGTDDSVFLRERVDDGRARVEAGEAIDVAYFEWSAPDDADDDDPATWQAAMPALGVLIDLDTIASDRAAMDRAEFARAYLNRWTAGGRARVRARRLDPLPRRSQPGVGPRGVRDRRSVRTGAAARSPPPAAAATGASMSS